MWECLPHWAGDNKGSSGSVPGTQLHIELDLASWLTGRVDGRTGLHPGLVFLIYNYAGLL